MNTFTPTAQVRIAAASQRGLFFVHPPRDPIDEPHEEEMNRIPGEQGASDREAKLGKAIEDDGEERAPSSKISTRHQKNTEERADVQGKATDVFEESRIAKQRHAGHHEPSQTRGREGTEARDHTSIRQTSVIDDFLRGVNRGQHVEDRDSRLPPLEYQHDSKRRNEQRDRSAIPQIEDSTDHLLPPMQPRNGTGFRQTSHEGPRERAVR